MPVFDDDDDDDGGDCSLIIVCTFWPAISVLFSSGVLVYLVFKMFIL